MQLFGGIVASVDSSKVLQGDTVVLTLDITGETSHMPMLETICDEEITASSKETSVLSEKGELQRSTRLTYEFSPMQDCTIPPIKVTVDAMIETTLPIDIQVAVMEVTEESPFILTMETAKQSVYVGEPFKVDVIFRQKHKSDAVDSKFLPPRLQDFWIKEELKAERYEEDNRSVSKMSFVMAAQKSGMLEISPAQIKIATRSRSRDALGQWLPALKWRTYFSNAIQLQVLPLPPLVTLVGQFAISAEADRQEIKANEAVNVTLRIEGSGNFEDMGLKKPKIDNVMVYAEAGETEASVKDGNYTGVWTKRFAFVSDSSYIIPVFKFRYFDPVERQLRSMATEPILVSVETKSPKEIEPLKIIRPEPKVSKTKIDLSFLKTWMPDSVASIVVGAVVGFVTALLLMLPPWRRWATSMRDSFISLRSRSRKEELQILLKHLDDLEAEKMVHRLESQLYEEGEVIIDKRALKRLLKRVESPRSDASR